MRGDRRDECFEGLGLQRRPEAGELHGQVLDHGLALDRPAVERLERDLRAEQLQHDGTRLVVEWRDVDAARSCADAHLPCADRPVQHAVDKPVRQVGAERTKPSGGKLEVERVR